MPTTILPQDQVTTRVTRVIPNWAAWLLFVVVYGYCVDAFNIPFVAEASDYFHASALGDDKTSAR